MTQPLSPHVCFVSLSAWPVLTGDVSIQHVGGAEVQQVILARGLTERGYRVSLICMDYGQPRECVVDGITVYSCHAPHEGLPVIRFLHPRLTTLWSAMKRANADIYYQRSCGALTGFVAAFCRRYRRKFIYAAAHDADFDPRLPVIRYARDRALYRWGLRHADIILTQSLSQRVACEADFKLPAVHLPNCYSPPYTATNDPNGYVLWIATMRRWKRPERFLDLAAHLAHLPFRMVGGPDDPGFYDDLQRRANTIPNLQFAGFIPYARIEQQFDGARVFVNTSDSEGFPNTFLQAWARAIPTVSFIECPPLARSRLRSSDSTDAMANTVSELMANDALWRATGQTCLQYFQDHHQPTRVVSALIPILERLTRQASHAFEPRDSRDL